MFTDTLTSVPAVASADHWHDGPGPWWPLIPLFWFAFVALLIFCFARFGRRRYCGAERAGRARLAQRFAAGEIDEAEYRSRLAVLDELDR